ncbi:MAG: hypothetical protein M3Q78_07295 [Acidobacteriota bacterium]|nr:hypothetical protein [Acidobacteriota bacterium]
MSDKKLDLILEVVTDIKVRQESLEKTVGKIAVKVDGLETRFDGLETRFDGLETRFDGLETRFDGLESEFKKFRRQVIEAFAKVQDRFTILEKQMVAIGIEIKEDIKREVETIGIRIDRLEKQIIFDRNDTLEHREEIRDIKRRLTQIENNLDLTV